MGLVGPENTTFWGVEDKKSYLANIEAFKKALPLRDSAKKQIEIAVRRVVDSKKNIYSPEMLALDDKIETYRNGTLGLGEYLEYLSRPNVVAQLLKHERVTELQRGNGAYQGIYKKASTSPPVIGRRSEHETATATDTSGNYNFAIQNPKLTKFPNVRLFLETYKLERTIDFQKVENERRILIEKLVSVLSKEELENLVYQAVSHRMGNINNGAYYRGLEAVCRKHGFKLNNWPELAQYVRYSIGADRIDRRALFNEINSLEENVVAQFTGGEALSSFRIGRRSTTPDKSGNYTTAAMEVYETSKNLSLVSKLVDNNLTDEEWKTYLSNKEKIHKTIVFPFGVFEKFYEVATSRNKILIENHLRRVKNETEIRQVKSTTGKDKDRVGQVKNETGKGKEQGSRRLQPAHSMERRINPATTNLPALNSNSSVSTSTCRISVLIAGGFHTQSMAKLLKEKQISYAVLSPKLTEVDTTKGAQYLEAFTQDRTPLDKLMLGEKIFLAVPSNMGTQNVLDLSGTQVHNSLWIALKAARKTMGLSHNEAVQIFQNLTELVKENKLPAIEAIEFGKRYISRVGSQVLPIWINGNGFTIEIAENKLTKTKDIEIQGELGAYSFTIRKPNIRERITSIISGILFVIPFVFNLNLAKKLGIRDLSLLSFAKDMTRLLWPFKFVVAEFDISGGGAIPYPLIKLRDDLWSHRMSNIHGEIAGRSNQWSIDLPIGAQIRHAKFRDFVFVAAKDMALQANEKVILKNEKGETKQFKIMPGKENLFEIKLEVRGDDWVSLADLLQRATELNSQEESLMSPPSESSLKQYGLEQRQLVKYRGKLYKVVEIVRGLSGGQYIEGIKLESVTDKHAAAIVPSGRTHEIVSTTEQEQEQYERGKKANEFLKKYPELAGRFYDSFIKGNLEVLLDLEGKANNAGENAAKLLFEEVLPELSVIVTEENLSSIALDAIQLMKERRIKPGTTQRLLSAYKVNWLGTHWDDIKSFGETDTMWYFLEQVLPKFKTYFGDEWFNSNYNKIKSVGQSIQSHNTGVGPAVLFNSLAQLLLRPVPNLKKSSNFFLEIVTPIVKIPKIDTVKALDSLVNVITDEPDLAGIIGGAADGARAASIKQRVALVSLSAFRKEPNRYRELLEVAKETEWLNEGAFKRALAESENRSAPDRQSPPQNLITLAMNQQISEKYGTGQTNFSMENVTDIFTLLQYLETEQLASGEFIPPGVSVRLLAALAKGDLELIVNGRVWPIMKHFDRKLHDQARIVIHSTKALPMNESSGGTTKRIRPSKPILSILVLLGLSAAETILGLARLASAEIFKSNITAEQTMSILNLLPPAVVPIIIVAGIAFAALGGWFLWRGYRSTEVGRTASPARAPALEQGMQGGQTRREFFQRTAIRTAVGGLSAYMVLSQLKRSMAEATEATLDALGQFAKPESPVPVEAMSSPRADKLVEGIVNHMAAGTSTGMSRSHIGMGGWLGKTGFLYDLAHNVIEADLGGTAEGKKFAEKTLDYLAQRLDIPIETVRVNADDNGVWGILQIFRPLNSEKDVIGILNGININNTSKQGEATEWWTTPGPVSWLILAMLHVNPDKYLNSAEKLAQTLIAMQDVDGSIVDGTRSDNRFTEPTIDVYSAMMLLHDLTGKSIYLDAATNILNWLYGNGVIDEDNGVIYLGRDSNGQLIKTHATDFYTWTIATLGLEQGLFSADLIKKFIERLEQKSLVYINYTRPDKKKVKGLLLADFTDPSDEEIKDARGGYHPMGIAEWTAGMILMYQVAAVRFYQEGDNDSAQKMKAKAEILLEDAWKTFYPYSVGGTKVLLASYATASWRKTFTDGWFTPIQQQVGDASSSSGWLAFLEQVFNPFFNTENNNNFHELYSAISPPPAKYKAKVRKDLIKQVVRYHPVYTETGSYSFPLNPDIADKPRFYEAAQGESFLDAFGNYFLEATNDGSTARGSAAIDLKLRPGIKKGMNIEFWIKKADPANPAKSVKIQLKSEYAGWQEPIYSKNIPVTASWKHVKIKLGKKLISELQKNAPDKKDVHIVQVGFEIGSAQTGNPPGSTVKVGAIRITNGKVTAPPIPEPVLEPAPVVLNPKGIPQGATTLSLDIGSARPGAKIVVQLLDANVSDGVERNLSGQIRLDGPGPIQIPLTQFPNVDRVSSNAVVIHSGQEYWGNKLNDTNEPVEVKTMSWLGPSVTKHVSAKKPPKRHFSAPSLWHRSHQSGPAMPKPAPLLGVSPLPEQPSVPATPGTEPLQREFDESTLLERLHGKLPASRSLLGVLAALAILGWTSLRWADGISNTAEQTMNILNLLPAGGMIAVATVAVAVVGWLIWHSHRPTKVGQTASQARAPSLGWVTAPISDRPTTLTAPEPLTPKEPDASKMPLAKPLAPDEPKEQITPTMQKPAPLPPIPPLSIEPSDKINVSSWLLSLIIGSSLVGALIKLFTTPNVMAFNDIVNQMGITGIAINGIINVGMLLTTVLIIMQLRRMLFKRQRSANIGDTTIQVRILSLGRAVWAKARALLKKHGHNNSLIPINSGQLDFMFRFSALHGGTLATILFLLYSATFHKTEFVKELEEKLPHVENFTTVANMSLNILSRLLNTDTKPDVEKVFIDFASKKLLEAVDDRVVSNSLLSGDQESLRHQIESGFHATELNGAKVLVFDETDFLQGKDNFIVAPFIRNPDGSMIFYVGLHFINKLIEIGYTDESKQERLINALLSREVAIQAAMQRGVDFNAAHQKVLEEPGQKGQEELMAFAIELVSWFRSAKTGIPVLNAEQAFNYHAPELTGEDKTAQEKMEERLLDAHGRIQSQVMREGGVTGAMSASDVNAMKKTIEQWIEDDVEQVVFMGDDLDPSSRAVLTKAASGNAWNPYLKSIRRPQVHFLESQRESAIQRLNHDLKLSRASKIRFVIVGNVSGEKLKGTLKGYSPKNAPAYHLKNSAALPLMAAGLVNENLMQDIYSGATQALNEWNSLRNDAAVKTYSPYRHAAHLIRMAMMGQNVHVFVMFSTALRFFAPWMASLFNKAIGTANLDFTLSGEWATSFFHSTKQGWRQSRGLNSRQEERGFISLSFLNPVEEGNAAVGKAAHHYYAGFGFRYFLNIFNKAATLVMSIARRPLIQTDMNVRTPYDLGRFIHYAQVSALMAGQLAEQAAGKKGPLSADQEKPLPLARSHGRLKLQQNVLNFDAKGNPSGLLMEKIQAEGKDSPTLKALAKIGSVVAKRLESKVVKAFQSGGALDHLNSDRVVEELKKSAAAAQLFKKKKRVYVVAIGGSTTGPIMASALNLKDGPEIIEVQSLDGGQTAALVKEIKNESDPDQIGIFIISKSGVTLETEGNAWTLIEALEKALVAKGGHQDDVKKNVLILTDPQLGDLRARVKRDGWLAMDHPTAIGGRWTMFSSVGLFLYYLKGGDPAALETSVKKLAGWEKKMASNLKVLKGLDTEWKASDPITIFNVLWKTQNLLSDSPVAGAWEGFIDNVTNRLLERDTEIALAWDPEFEQLVSHLTPFYPQLRVESKSKPGVRFYAQAWWGLPMIKKILPRVITNRKAYVHFFGIRGQDISSDFMVSETMREYEETLQGRQVPFLSLEVDQMTPDALVQLMFYQYIRLAVDAALYEPMDVDSEGQPGVEQTKAVVRSFLAKIWEFIQREKPDDHEKKTGLPIPLIAPDQIEESNEQPFDLKGAFQNMDDNLSDILNLLILGNDAVQGLGSIQFQRRIQATRVADIPEFMRTYYWERFDAMKIDTRSSLRDEISKIIVDGKEKNVSDRGRAIIRATSLESIGNLQTGTANGTNFGIYENKQDGDLTLVASVQALFGSSVRITISFGNKTQDYILKDDGNMGKLVEIDRMGEGIVMAVSGNYLASGGRSFERPPAYQAFERVVQQSMNTSIRYSNALSADAYTILNKQGLLTEWMTLAEARELAQLFGAAGGMVMTLTKKGMTHVRDIPMISNDLVNEEKIYVIAGSPEQVKQTQIFMELLYPQSQGILVLEDILLSLTQLPDDIPLQKKVAALMWLIQLKEGLAILPKKDILGNGYALVITQIEERVRDIEKKLNREKIIKELMKIYLDKGHRKRGEFSTEDFILLGSPDAHLLFRLPPDASTMDVKDVYRLQELFKYATPLQFLSRLAQGVPGTLAEDVKRLTYTYKNNDLNKTFSDGAVRDSHYFGETIQDYLRDSAGVADKSFADKDIGLQSDSLPPDAQVVFNSVFDIYLNDQDVTDFLEDKDLSELVSREPSIFYRNGSRVWVKSLHKIRTTLKENKYNADVNMSGDVSSRLDHIYNTILVAVLKEQVDIIVSEENEDVIGDPGKKGRRLVLYLDPIDGSSQIKDGLTFGLIVTVGILKPDQKLSEFDPRTQVLGSMDMQFGWPRTVLSYVNRKNRSTGRPEVMQFELVHQDNVQVFKKTVAYEPLLRLNHGLTWDGLFPRMDEHRWLHFAMGGSFVDSLTTDGHREVIKKLIATFGYELAYTGALVNDIRKLLRSEHQAMGILHTYAATAKHPHGRFRLAFELYHYALMFEALGGEVIDGHRPMLNNRLPNVEPSGAEKEFYAGSPWITKFIMAWRNHVKVYITGRDVQDSDLEDFLTDYKTKTSQFIQAVNAYSSQAGRVSKTEGDIREALFLYYGDIMPLLSMTDKEAYETLFPNDSQGEEESKLESGKISEQLKGQDTILRTWLLPIIAGGGLVLAMAKLLTTPNAMAFGGVLTQAGIAGIAINGIISVMGVFPSLLTTALIIMQVRRIFRSNVLSKTQKQKNVIEQETHGTVKFRGLLEQIIPLRSKISEVIANWKTSDNVMLKRKLKLRTAKNAILVATLAWAMGSANVTGNYDSGLTNSPETFISAANFLNEEELPKGEKLKEMEKRIGAIVDQIGKELRELKKSAKSLELEDELDVTGVEHGFKAEIAKMEGLSLKKTLKKQTRELKDRLNAQPVSRETIESVLQDYAEATKRGRWLAAAVKRGDTVQTMANYVKEKDVRQFGAQMRVLDVTRLLESEGQLGMNYTVAKLREYQKMTDNLSDTERNNVGLQLVSRVEGIDSDAEVKKRVQDILASKEVGADLIQLVESAEISLYKTMKASGLIRQVELRSSENGAKRYVNQIDTEAFAYKWFKQGIKVLIAAEDPRGWTPIDDEQMAGLVEILLFVIKDHEIDVSRTIRNYYSIERAVDIGA